jgi:hypothetical protein
VHAFDGDCRVLEADLIPALLHGLDHLIEPHSVWLIVQRRGFCGQIHLRFLHPREAAQHFFDTGYASGTVHAANSQIETLCFHQFSPASKV